MAESVERLVNLALFLAHAQAPVRADDIRERVAGYPKDQEDAAFKRMLERDKDDLRASGLAIEADEEGNYRLDRRATYIAPLELTPEELATVRTAGAAVLSDPSFPFAEDLRLALAKISAEVERASGQAGALLADEEPEQQGGLVAELASAAGRRKRVSFGYTNSLGRFAPHEVEPYGLFLHDGRWYAVGRDTEKDEVRTYAVARIAGLQVNPSAPKTADFARPEDFDVATHIRLPFQYGPSADEFEAVLFFDPSVAWRAPMLAAGHGRLEPSDEGLVWRISARSRHKLLRFVVENGPGIRVLGPPALVEDARAGLARVEALHG